MLTNVPLSPPIIDPFQGSSEQKHIIVIQTSQPAERLPDIMLMVFYRSETLLAGRYSTCLNHVKRRQERGSWMVTESHDESAKE